MSGRGPSAADTPLRRAPLLVGLLALLWILSLVLQDAYPDEVEHLHVAWLVGKLGLVPLRDFFQHHTPLLWELLAPYYRWGGDGAEGLFYGRAIVVVCAVGITLGVYRLARERASDRGACEHAFALAMVSFVTISVTFVALVTLRPETLSAALASLALACWLSGTAAGAAPPAPARRLALDAAAGALFGAALYSSPRFALLGGIFFLFGARPDRILEGPLARLALLAAGAVGGFAALATTTGYGFEYLKFAVLFSAHLQKVGEPGLLEGQYGQLHARMPWLLAAVTQVVYVFVAFFFLLPRAERRRLALHVAYTAAVLAISLAVSWPYFYVQNFYPALLLVALQIAYFAARLDWRGFALGRIYLGASAALCALALFWSVAVSVAAGETLLDAVLFRKQMLKLVRENESVLVAYENHPIAARDASFYGPGLVDSQDRMCQAVATWTGGPALPPCDYYEDLVARNPVIVDFRLRTMMPLQKRGAGQALMAQRYEPAVFTSVAGKLKLRGVYVQPAILERARSQPAAR